MATSLNQLSISTLADECHQAIKRAILNLDLQPGAPIDEGQLAEQLGISKTPVREAIARLTGEGFVVPGPGRRSSIAPLSVVATREIFEVRILLESSVARYVAPRLTDEDLAQLEAALETTDEALRTDNLYEFVMSAHEFHSRLVDCAANSHLSKIAAKLFDHTKMITSAIYRSEQEAAQHQLSQNGIANHRAILAALKQRDGELAASLLTRDIQTYLDAINTDEIQRAFERLSYRPGGAS
jgi:DNA-binding GntR family transcriptional regulator